MYYHLIQQGHSKTEQVVENNNLKELAERTINAVHPGRSRDTWLAHLDMEDFETNRFWMLITIDNL